MTTLTSSVLPSLFVKSSLNISSLYLAVGEPRARGSRAEAQAEGEHAHCSQTTLHSVGPRTRAWPGLVQLGVSLTQLSVHRSRGISQMQEEPVDPNRRIPQWPRLSDCSISRKKWVFALFYTGEAWQETSQTADRGWTTRKQRGSWEDAWDKSEGISLPKQQK